MIALLRSMKNSGLLPPSALAASCADSARLAESRCSSQCQGMMTFTELASVPSDPLAPLGLVVEATFVATFAQRFIGK